MTIVELQAFIDTKPDIRSIINEMADYLQANPPGGGGSGFPASLAADTTVDLNGKVLHFAEGGIDRLMLDPVSGESTLRSFDATDDGSYAEFTASTNATSGSFVIRSTGQNSHQVIIESFSDATTSTLAYSADTHTVNGDMILAGLAGNGVGIVAVDNDGKLSWAAA